MSIKNKLAILFAGMIMFVTLTTNGITIYKYRQNALNIVKEDVLKNALDNSRVVETFLKNQIANLDIIIKVGNSQSILLKKYETLNEFLRINQSSMSKNIERLDIVNKENIILSSSHETYIGKEIFFSDEEKIRLSNNEIVITNFSSSDKGLIIAKAIMENEEYVGAIIETVNLNGFNDLIKELCSFDREKVIIIDSHGNVIATNSESIDDNINEVEPIYNSLNMENIGESIEYTLDYKKKIGAYYNIKDTDFTVFTSVEWSEFTSSIDEEIRMMILIIIIISIVIVISYLVIVKYISKPIYEFITTMHNTKENYYEVFKYDGKDEFGKIADSYNDLIKHLSDQREKIINSNNKLNSLIKNVPAGMISLIYVNEKWEINYVNFWCYKILGYTEEEIRDNYNNIIDMVYEMDKIHVFTVFKSIVTGSEYGELEVRVKNKNNKLIWVKVKVNGIYNSHGELERVVGIVIDINAEKNRNEKLLFKAQRDSLTGIYNKGTTVELIEDYIEKNKKSAFIIIIDVDNFKLFNDLLGHIYGDEALVSVVTTLKSTLKNDSIIGRIGGDEFCVFLKNTESEEEVISYIEGFLENLRKMKIGNEKKLSLLVSMGIAKYPKDGLGFNELYIKADKAMYLTKKKGRNGYSIFTEDK